MIDPSVGEFGKVAKGFIRNPLGIIGLFIVLIYGLAIIALAVSKIDLVSQRILVGFIVLFPLFVAVVFYKLVSIHYNKLYAPADFKDESNYLKALGLTNKLEFDASDNGIELFSESVRAISSLDNDNDFEPEIKKAYLKQILIPFGPLILDMLSLKIEGTLRIEDDSQNQSLNIYRGDEWYGSSLQSSFLQAIISLNTQSIISVKNSNPFDFQINEKFKTTINNLRQELKEGFHKTEK